MEKASKTFNIPWVLLLEIFVIHLVFWAVSHQESLLWQKKYWYYRACQSWDSIYAREIKNLFHSKIENSFPCKHTSNVETCSSSKGCLLPLHAAFLACQHVCMSYTPHKGNGNTSPNDKTASVMLFFMLCPTNLSLSTDIFLNITFLLSSFFYSSIRYCRKVVLKGASSVQLQKKQWIHGLLFSVATPNRL